MGVYVPNIKEPKHCTECYFVSRDQCELQDNSYDYDTFKEQRKHCPLIEIPTPHGRLIDGDDIYIGRWDIDTDLAEQIHNAPTILEAEE